LRILVTGGAGFIGSVLVPRLISRGDEVRVVDIGLFGLQHLDSRVDLIERDILEFDNEWLRGMDAVIHLAGLSNDPMAAFSPKLNYVLNAAGTGIVAQAAKQAGIRKFVFGSTCSVYGLEDKKQVTEKDEPCPSFPYAISKLMGERALLCLTDYDFRPVILRKGTVIGRSSRMRFDLVTNTMIKTALTQNRIFVNNPKIWRPLLDVADAAQAYINALDADVSVTGIFNVASANITIGELAKEVSSTLGEFGIDVPIETASRHDDRSYRVSSEKAIKLLNFRPTKSISDSVRDVMRYIEQNEITDFDDPMYHNILGMKRFLSNKRLISNLNEIPTF